MKGKLTGMVFTIVAEFDISDDFMDASDLLSVMEGVGEAVEKLREYGAANVSLIEAETEEA